MITDQELRELERLEWACREGAHSPEDLDEALRELGEYVERLGLAARIREMLQ